MADDIKTFIKEQAEETRRHFDVVAENLESKLDTVTEQVVANAEILTQHGQRLGRIETKLEQIDDRIAVVETTLEAVNLPAIKQKLTRLEERVGALEATQKN